MYVCIIIIIIIVCIIILSHDSEHMVNVCSYERTHMDTGVVYNTALFLLGALLPAQYLGSASLHR